MKREQYIEQHRLLLLAARALEVSEGRTPADDTRVTRALREINKHLAEWSETQKKESRKSVASEPEYWCRVTQIS